MSNRQWSARDVAIGPASESAKSALLIQPLIGSPSRLRSSNETLFPRRSASLQHPWPLSLDIAATHHDALPVSSCLHRTKSLLALQRAMPSLDPAAHRSHHAPWPAAQGLGRCRMLWGSHTAADLIYELVTAPHVARFCISSLLPLPLSW